VRVADVATDRRRRTWIVGVRLEGRERSPFLARIDARGRVRRTTPFAEPLPEDSDCDGPRQLAFDAHARAVVLGCFAPSAGRDALLTVDARTGRVLHRVELGGRCGGTRMRVDRTHGEALLLFSDCADVPLAPGTYVQRLALDGAVRWSQRVDGRERPWQGAALDLEPGGEPVVAGWLLTGDGDRAHLEMLRLAP